MNTVRPISRNHHRLINDVLHPHSINIMHRKCLDAQCSDLLLLVLIQITKSDIHQIGRIHKGTSTSDLRQIKSRMPQKRSHAHSMHIPSQAMFFGIQVCMSIEPGHT
ncbi:hypothetical protein D3C74_405600 [compost metagenome]